MSQEWSGARLDESAAPTTPGRLLEGLYDDPVRWVFKSFEELADLSRKRLPLLGPGENSPVGLPADTSRRDAFARTARANACTLGRESTTGGSHHGRSRAVSGLSVQALSMRMYWSSDASERCRVWSALPILMCAPIGATGCEDGTRGFVRAA